MIGNIRRILGKYSIQKSPIFIFSFVVLFWTIFDSIMGYVTPLIIEERGYSLTMIGIIIGTSSIGGAIFDFLICKIFKSTEFRRIFLIMFAICFIYPLLLWQAKTVWFFIFVMSVWGIYFDLYGFGVFNFIGRYTKKADHSAGFGIVQVFRALGEIIAPLFIGLVAVSYVDWRSLALGWIFLGLGFIVFIALLFSMRKKTAKDETACNVARRKSLFVEIHLWKKLGKMMSPVLLVTFYLFFIDAFFWTLAPLYAESANLRQFSGLFLTAYTLPALFVGWFVGKLTRRYGKKRTAILGMLIGSVVLSPFAFFASPYLAIIAVFAASLFTSISYPAISGAYADYISEAPQVEGEIEGIEDFSFNLGYVVGPILAGILGDHFSIPAAFSILGVIGTILALVLLAITPKQINITTKRSEL